MQRLCALCSHGAGGQIPAYVLNISTTAIVWWDLRGSRATTGGATTTAVPTVLFTCPASDVAPALGTARGSINKIELVPLSSKKDFLFISPNCAKVAVKHSVYTHSKAVEYWIGSFIFFQAGQNITCCISKSCKSWKHVCFLSCMELLYTYCERHGRRFLHLFNFSSAFFHSLICVWKVSNMETAKSQFFFFVVLYWICTFGSF